MSNTVETCHVEIALQNLQGGESESFQLRKTNFLSSQILPSFLCLWMLKAYHLRSM